MSLLSLILLRIKSSPGRELTAGHAGQVEHWSKAWVQQWVKMLGNQILGSYWDVWSWLEAVPLVGPLELSSALHFRAGWDSAG